MEVERLATGLFALMMAQACQGCSPSAGLKGQERTEAPMVPRQQTKVLPTLDVEVAQSNGQYLVSWRKCGDETVRLKMLNVHVDQHIGSQIVPTCSLSASGEGGTNGSWPYGVEVPGTKLRTCKPLERGHEYSVDVDAGMVGWVRFRIDADGAVELMFGSC